MMTYREKMLATLQGKPTDCLPFVPRLDLWYKSNRYRGTLPDKYKHASLMQIIEDLDVGYHSVTSDRDLYDDSLDNIDRALGIWRVHTMPHHDKFRDIKRNISYEGDTTVVEYITPVGNIRTKVVYDESMRAAGITLSHVSEHAIKSVEDYEAVAYLFEHVDVYPNYEGVARLKEEVGDRALIVGTASMGCSAMHHILHELIPYDLFFYEYYDHKEELDRLAARMTPYINKVLDVAINSPADIIQSGTNYDAQITWPAFMEEYVAPYLAANADKLHAAGKFLLTHTDGENKGLLPYYLTGNIDIADSVTPAPMTSLSLGQIREAFNDKITIWGGVPSITVLENSMSDYEFDVFINDLFENQIGRGDHLILSIADTAPPAMKFSRLERIAKMAREFGPVRP
ncbi:MAG: uroporphyrinogen decarboxylase family protein [Negativicutes bacterium]|nr:uroporphyrinogen decarboxylase family protein [Negativicutes bacterium]